MRVGLTGGIASGKTAYEQELRRLGYPVFDTDKIMWAVRSGDVPADPDDDIFRHRLLVELVAELSVSVRQALKREFPSLYDCRDRFDKSKLLEYIDNEKYGFSNYITYSRITQAAEIETYRMWEKLVGESSVFSSGVLIEMGALKLVDMVFLLHCTVEQQVENFMRRQVERGHQPNEEQAIKAIKRQYPFSQRQDISKKALGEDRVHVLNSVSSLADLLVPLPMI